jgi:hypothetical protein
MKEYGKYQVFSILDRTDLEASARLKRVWKHGLEYSHADAVDEAKDMYILAKSVRIARDLKNMTCPVKSLAIFVHNRDITYEQHEMLRLFDDCKEQEDVYRLARQFPDLVPPILLDQSDADPRFSETLFFNQDFYTQAPKSTPLLRLVLWTKFVGG